MGTSPREAGLIRLNTATIRPPGPWADQALCRDNPDPDIFFPTDQDHQTAAQARDLCGRCPVRDQCLKYALSNNERYGIWGGLDPAERAALRRRQRGAAQRNPHRKSAA